MNICLDLASSVAEIVKEDTVFSETDSQQQSPLPLTSSTVNPNFRNNADKTDNAFSKLIAGRREENEWADALANFTKKVPKSQSPAIDKNATNSDIDFGKRLVRKCPFYKIMNLSPGVAVDAFSFGAVPGISMYFLTYV